MSAGVRGVSRVGFYATGSYVLTNRCEDTSKVVQGRTHVP